MQNICDQCGMIVPCLLNIYEPGNSHKSKVNDVQKAAVPEKYSEASVLISKMAEMQSAKALQTHQNVKPFGVEQRTKMAEKIVDTCYQKKLVGKTKKIRSFHGFDSPHFVDIDTTGFPRTIFVSNSQLIQSEKLDSLRQQVEANSYKEAATYSFLTEIKPGFVKKVIDKIENASAQETEKKAEINTLFVQQNHFYQTVSTEKVNNSTLCDSLDLNVSDTSVGGCESIFDERTKSLASMDKNCRSSDSYNEVTRGSCTSTTTNSEKYMS